MNLNIKKKSFVLLFMVLFFSAMGFYSMAQKPASAIAKDSIQIDSSNLKVEEVPWAKIEKFRKTKAFDYGFKQQKGLNLWERFMFWLQQILEAIFSKEGVAPYLRILFVLIVVGLIVFLIFRSNISGIFSRNKRAKKLNGLSYFDEDIHTQDLDNELNRALAEQDYRKAIRYYYLKLLKQLDTSELIQWNISKTNHEYQRELANHRILSNFIILSGIYEYTWYGHFNVDLSHFNDWQSDFQAALKIANQKQ